MSEAIAEPQKTSPARRVVWGVLSIAVMVGLFAWILRDFDWAEFGSLLVGMKLLPFVGGLSIMLGAVALHAYRWHWCIESTYDVPYRQLLRLTLVSYFFNNICFSFVGGDLYRGYHLSRVLGATRAALSLLLVRVTILWGAAVMPGWFLLAGETMAEARDQLRGVVIIGLALWLGTLAVPLLLRLYGQGLIGSSFPLFHKIGLLSRTDLIRGRNLAVLLITAVLFQVLAIWVHWLYARALGIDIGFAPLCVVVPSVLLLASLPISPSGLGVREGGFVGLLGLFGVKAEAAVALSLVTYAGLVFIGVIGGLVLAYDQLVVSKRH